MTRINFLKTLKIVGLILAMLSLDLIWPDTNLIPIIAAVVITVWVAYQLWPNYIGWEPPTRPQIDDRQQPSHLCSTI